MDDPETRALNNQLKQEHGNLLHSDASTIEKSEGRKIPRDPELEKGALSEVGLSGKPTSTRGFEGAVRNIVYGDGDLAEGVVEGPDDRREGSREEKPLTMSEVKLMFKPEWIERIESEQSRRDVALFVKWWKDEAVKDEDLMIGVDVAEGENGGQLRLVFSKDEDWHDVSVKDVFTVFAMEDGTTGFVEQVGSEMSNVSTEMLCQVIEHLEIDGVSRPGIVVLNEDAVKYARGKRETKEKEKEKEDDRYEVVVHLEKLGWQDGKNEVRKRVAEVVGIMEMRTGKPEVEVLQRSDGVLLMQASNGEHVGRVVRLEDLFKIMPEVSKMGSGTGRHYSLNGRSVDASSSPEEWQRFFGSMKIKRKAKV
ncbi:hypothetical protein KKG65_00910 [Patescibacteria group bacterium]|nr:hypothetical protein [Patescibacteria group bacterium]